MSDAISKIRSTPAALPTTGPGAASRDIAPGNDFASLMREQIDKVSGLQSEADAKVQQLVTGQNQNLTEVFAANQKAKVAFSLLMEVRNKLVEAYQELQNMRV